jgi:hypothetical protein
MWKSGRRPVDPSSRKDERDAIEEAADGNAVEHNPYESLHPLYKWKHILIIVEVEVLAPLHAVTHPMNRCQERCATGGKECLWDRSEVCHMLVMP